MSFMLAGVATIYTTCTFCGPIEGKCTMAVPQDLLLQRSAWKTKQCPSCQTRRYIIKGEASKTQMPSTTHEFLWNSNFKKTKTQRQTHIHLKSQGDVVDRVLGDAPFQPGTVESSDLILLSSSAWHLFDLDIMLPRATIHRDLQFFFLSFTSTNTTSN